MNNYNIEFVGMAGVGKSYIANKLLDSLKSKEIILNQANGVDYNYSKVDTKALINSIYILKNTKPKITINSLKTIIAMYLNFCKLNKVNNNKESVTISDQGIFQSIGTLRKYSRGKHRLFWTTKNAKNIKVANLVVVVQASAETIASRRYQRDGKLELEDINQGKLREELLIKELVYLKKTRANFDYIIIDYEDLNNIDNIINEIQNKWFEWRK